jgi:hypothetical protein
MDVTLTARSTGRSLKLKVVELLEVIRGRARCSEVLPTPRRYWRRSLTTQPHLPDDRHRSFRPCR